MRQKMRCVGTTYNTKDTKVLDVGVWVVVSIKLMHQSKVSWQKKFPTNLKNVSLSTACLMGRIIDGKVLGYVQCDFEVPQHLRLYFSNILLISISSVVSKDDFGTLMNEYTEKENTMVQPKKNLYQAFSELKERYSSLYFSFTWSLGWCVGNFKCSFNSFPKIASTPSHDVKGMKI